MGRRRMFHLVAFAALLAATVAVAINPAGAETKSVQADADAKVAESSPTTNFGTSTALNVDRAPLTESYARFIVPGLTGVVERATLRLFAVNGGKNGPSLYRSDPVWNETGINWNNRPARTSAKLANAGRVNAGNYVDFDVTAVVTGSGTYSFNVVPDSRDNLQFNSKEAATNLPQLLITLSEPDTTAPNTTITSGPSGTVQADSVSFTFSSSEANSTFECRLDGDSFAACSSPKTYPGLSTGLHTFEVRALDQFRNADPTPASRAFTVDPNAPGDPVLVGAGDIAGCSSAGDEATAALLDGIDGTVFTVGDNVYDSGTAAEFTNCYNPSWGRHKFRTRPAAGNHEYVTAGASGYYNYFGAAAGPAGKGYYSYNLGAWHVIVLNSQCNAVGGCGPGSPQDQWLRADLAASNAACTVAIWHHPLFSSSSVHGSSTATLNFWEALYQAGADVVISGHDHVYERFAPQTPGGVLDVDFGLRQFTAGMGGRSHYGFATAKPNSQVRNSDTYGVLKLSLHTNSYDWQFVPEAGKSFTDTGTDVTCHGAPSTEPPPPPPPPPPPGTGPVAFRSASSDGSSSSRTSITISKPAGTVAGDVMVASIVQNDALPVSAPAGWTSVREDAVGTAIKQSVFVRVAGASEPSSYTWSLGNYRRITGGISSYSGVDTAHPIDAHNGATGESTSITAPSVTTTTAGAMILHLAGINAEGNISPPAGSTERWENTAFNTSNTRDALAESSDSVQASAGATDDRTANATQSGRWVGVLVALRPAL